MKNKIPILHLLVFMAICFSSGQVFGDTLRSQVASSDRLAELVQCMTEKGWVMYSSFTCSACRAQRNLFGPAADHLKIIECNPHAPDNQAQQCLKMKIRYTPTWLLEKNGTEIKRIKGYKKLNDLAVLTGCAQ
jgi:hypothetical protein